MVLPHDWQHGRVSPRFSDRCLGAAQVFDLVGEQFSNLQGRQVRFLAAGWDNELFMVGEDWVFRFPKRAQQVPWLLREIEIMPVMAEALGTMVPRFEYVGEPSPAFPYPFVGYRFVPGKGADQIESLDQARLAEDLARLLSRLHRVDTSRIPATPAGPEATSWSALRTGLVGVASTVRPLLDRGLLTLAEPYLVGAVPEPEQHRPGRFIHNDICPDHLLVDPVSGQLSGVIDFTDAIIGDPVLDFVGLIGVGDRAFIDQVVANYALPLDDRFGSKLQWLTRVLTLTWLEEARLHDPGAVSKHATWVRRAFAG